MADDEPLLVFSTVPDRETGRIIAGALVDEKLAACVSILPGVESHFFWENRREQVEELLLLIKTTRKVWESVKERVIQLHPYDCPEVVAVEIVAAHELYRKWLENNTAIPQID